MSPDIGLKIPDEERARFLNASSGLYPEIVISGLLGSRYDPLIIGYEHNMELFQTVTDKVEVEEALKSQEMKAALGMIPPTQIQYIKDFLGCEKEFRSTGRLRDSSRTPGKTVRSFEDYRAKLRRNFSESLALWLLEKEIQTIPLDHEDTENWIREDRVLYPEVETFGL